MKKFADTTRKHYAIDKGILTIKTENVNDYKYKEVMQYLSELKAILTPLSCDAMIMDNGDIVLVDDTGDCYQTYNLFTFDLTIY